MPCTGEPVCIAPSYAGSRPVSKPTALGNIVRCRECGKVYRELDELEDLRDNDSVCLVCNNTIEVADWDRVLASYEDEDAEGEGDEDDWEDDDAEAGDDEADEAADDFDEIEEEEGDDEEGDDEEEDEDEDEDEEEEEDDEE